MPMEEPRQEIPWDARSLVVDLNHGPLSILPASPAHAHDNRYTVGRVLDGIADEVLHRLAQTRRVPLHDQLLRRSDVDLRAIGLRPVDDAMDQIHEIDPLTIEREDAAVQARGIEEIGHHTAQIAQ